MGARQHKPMRFLDTMRLLFYQQAADRKNHGKTCCNDPVDNPRMRLFMPANAQAALAPSMNLVSRTKVTLVDCNYYSPSSCHPV